MHGLPTYYYCYFIHSNEGYNYCSLVNSRILDVEKVKIETQENDQIYNLKDAFYQNRRICKIIKEEFICNRNTQCRYLENKCYSGSNILASGNKIFFMYLR